MKRFLKDGVIISLACCCLLWGMVPVMAEEPQGDLYQRIEVNGQVYIGTVEYITTDLGTSSKLRVYQYDDQTATQNEIYKDTTKQMITALELSVDSEGVVHVIATNEATGLSVEKVLTEHDEVTAPNSAPEAELDTLAVLGDVNNDGQINATDALMVLRHSVKEITLSDSQFTSGDVDSNGDINATDALNILRYSVKEIDHFEPSATKKIVSIGDKGIDVSVWNNVTSWGAVAGETKYAFIRTGSGHGLYAKDSTFNSKYTGATEAGLPVGAYHYTYALNTAQAEQEAAYCLESINGRSMDLPVAFDIEDDELAGLSKTELTDICIAFCEKIKVAGYEPMIYANLNWLNKKLDYSRLSQYKIWLAQWDPSPSFGGDFAYWQYGKGGVSGINGEVDLNKSYINVYR